MSVLVGAAVYNVCAWGMWRPSSVYANLDYGPGL